MRRQREGGPSGRTLLLRIALIDDVAADRALAADLIGSQMPGATFVHCGTEQQLAELLDGNPPSVALIGYALAWTDGLSVLRQLKARWPTVPVVMFTGSGNEEVAVEAMKAGLDDYVIKHGDQAQRLVIAVQTAVEHAHRQRALAASEARFQALVERLPGIVYIDPLDASRAADRYVSPGITEILGYARDEWLADPASWEHALHPDDRERALAMVRGAIAHGAGYGAEYRMLARDGRVVHIRDQAAIVSGPTGEPEVIGLAFDITREREIETELAEEVGVRESVAASLARLTPGPTAEATGSAICAELLRLPEVDMAVVAAFEGPDVVPLAMIAPPGAPIALGRPIPPHRAAYVQERAARRGPWADDWSTRPDTDPYVQAWNEVGLSTMGYMPLVLAGEPYGVLWVGSTISASIERAARWLPTMSLLAAAANGILAPQLLEQRQLTDRAATLRTVIDERLFTPVFQPIVELGSDQVVGFEALSRFSDGASPERRFGDAERLGLSVELELAAIETAIAAAASLPRDTWLSVNLSPPVLVRSDAVLPILRAADRPLVVEVTERRPIDDYALVRASIERLQSAGLPLDLAVDDAGAGYASMRHIVELRPRYVKLDMGLVHGVHADAPRQALIAGMVHFALGSASEIIAEGIEKEDERAVLQRLGVRYGQGYLLGHPGPPPVRSDS